MMTAPRSFLFLLASGRDGGNTETLAREAAAHLPEHTAQRWLRLADHPLPAFEDIRHAGEGPHQPSTDNERLLLDATLAATDIVIASPVYWYSVSSSAKLYLDYWSNWLRIPDLGFKARMGEKTYWSVSALADEDPAKAEPLLGTLRLSAEFFGARWGGGLLGNGSWPGDVRADTSALDRARTFFAAEHSLAPALS